MKSKTLFRVVALLLIFATMVSISACSKNGSEKEQATLPQNKINTIDYNVEIENNTDYNCISKTRTNYYVFEVICTKETAEEEAATAIPIMTENFDGIKWYCALIDEDGVFLGEISNGEYIPYVYERYYEPYTTPPFTTPFVYYFIKYFANIDCAGYEYLELLNNSQGMTEYRFTIHDVDPAQMWEVKPVMQIVADLMSKTLQNNIVIRIVAFEGTADEIIVEATCS